MTTGVGGEPRHSMGLVNPVEVLAQHGPGCVTGDRQRFPGRAGHLAEPEGSGLGA